MKNKEPKKIAIIGIGKVGKEMNKVFPDAVIYDEPKGIGTKKEVNKCDLAIICVPTPSKDNGDCDTSIVEEIVAWLKTPLILIRSTIKPGTTDILSYNYGKKIIFIPEYIGESKYKNPIMKTESDMPFFIFGGLPSLTQRAVDIFQPVFGPLVKYIQVSSIEAELAKYFENAFFAVKVTLCNEFYDICQAYGVSWDIVRELWLNDPRINRMHTSVFKNKRGFGGKCLPKDLKAIINSSKEQGYTPKILKLVDKINE